MRHLLKIGMAMAMAFMALTVMAPSASAEGKSHHRKTVGLRAGFAQYNTSGFGGLFFEYQFSKVVSVRPSLDLVVKNKGCDAYIFNLDGLFSLPLRSQKWDLYMLCGGGFDSWNKGEHDEFGEFSSQRHTEIGLNLGGGVAVQATRTLRLSLEAKGNIVKNYTTAVVGMSIGYCF